MSDVSVPSQTQQFWEDFYQDRDRIWSGNPNPLLVREAAPLAPGTALDLGCGEGADAIWLAGRGWRVTAVDVSETALRRAAEHAAQAGITDRVTWARHDLAQSFPGGLFDLVSVQFFHSPVAQEGEWQRVLRQAAGAVAPGGTMLIVGHAGWPSWLEAPRHDLHFPTTSEVLDALGLPADRWQVELEDRVESKLTGPEGQPGHREDSLVRIRRTR